MFWLVLTIQVWLSLLRLHVITWIIRILIILIIKWQIIILHKLSRLIHRIINLKWWIYSFILVLCLIHILTLRVHLTNSIIWNFMLINFVIIFDIFSLIRFYLYFGYLISPFFNYRIVNTFFLCLDRMLLNQFKSFTFSYVLGYKYRLAINSWVKFFFIIIII